MITQSLCQVVLLAIALQLQQVSPALLSNKTCSLVREDRAVSDSCFLEPECGEECKTVREQDCETVEEEHCNTLEGMQCEVIQVSQGSGHTFHYPLNGLRRLTIL